MTDDNVAQTVLIVDDDRPTRWILARILQSAGFDCVQASDGEQAVGEALRLRPDLILMDVSMPGLGGLGALEAIRGDFRTTSTPVIFLTADGALDSLVEHLTAGADDYLVKPAAPAELVARAKLALRRAADLRDLNPLTGLSGNGAILREMTARIAGRRSFSAMHVDIDNFKAYNDRYGFARGDGAIKATADVLIDALGAVPDTEHFLGHIGGDDFLVLAAPEVEGQLAREVLHRFDAVVPSLYDGDDRRRGWIEVRDRRGNVRPASLVSLSIGIAASDPRRPGSAGEIAAAASEMKGVAKRQTGSTWAVDRRRSASAGALADTGGNDAQSLLPVHP